MLSKAKISGVDKNGKPVNTNWFYVQFNPNELSIDEPCAQSTASAEGDAYEKGDGEGALHLSTTLFFNTLTSLSQTSPEDVRGYIRKFYTFTNQDKNRKENLKKICFSWGSLCIVGILQQLNVTYTMFSQSGIPVRCTASISIEGVYYGEPPKGLAAKKEEKLTEQTSFMDALRSFEEPQDWKKEAKQQGIGKARSA